MWFRSTSHRSPLQQIKSHRANQRHTVSRPSLEMLERRQLLSLSPAMGYPVGDAPQAVVTADFNSDGRLDLATANYYGGTVSVLLGGGDGTFQQGPSSAAGWMPKALAAGDFDRDGRPDLATAGGSGVNILLGNGDGTFRAGASIGVAYAESVAVGDLNNDGMQDLVVTGSSVTVILGAGDATFQMPAVQWADDGLLSAVIADLNGDGNQDLAATDVNDAQVRTYLGDGAGSLHRHGSSPTGDSPWSLAAGDVNGDGRMDVVTANRGGHSATVLLGDGAGGFAQRQDFDAGFDPTSVALADFDRDGDLDIAVADFTRMNILKGSGNGSFTSFSQANSFATGMGAYAVTAGDFDSDGWLDAATANTHADTVSVLINDRAWSGPVPSLSVGDVSVVEGNSGVTYITFTVSLSAASDEPVTVEFATQDGTATAGSDYQAASGTVSFAPGETTKTVRVAIFGDTLIENDEHFSLVLSNAGNASILDGSGTGTILNDDKKGGKKR